MKNWLVAFAGWAAAILVWGFMVEQSHAQEQPKCGPYDVVITALNAPRWGEAGWAEFTTTTENIPGQWFKSARGTFTIIVIPKPGVACIVFSGQDLAPMRPDFPTKPKVQGP